MRPFATPGNCYTLAGKEGVMNKRELILYVVIPFNILLILIIYYWFF